MRSCSPLWRGGWSSRFDDGLLVQRIADWFKNALRDGRDQTFAPQVDEAS